MLFLSNVNVFRFFLFFDNSKGVFGVFVCVSFIFVVLLVEIDCDFSDVVVVFFCGVIVGGEGVVVVIVGLGGLSCCVWSGLGIMLLKLG